MAKLHRSWIRVTDKWSIDIYDHDVVDPRLLVMLGTFKTDADNKKAREEREKRSEEEQNSLD